MAALRDPLNVSVHHTDANVHVTSEDDEKPLTYDVFLRFGDPSAYAEYREFKIATTNPFLATATLLMYGGLLLTRGNVKHNTTVFSDWWQRGHGLGFTDVNEAMCVVSSCVQMVAVASVVTALISRNVLRGPSRKSTHEAPVFNAAANIATVMFGFSPALRTLAKVLHGPCLADTSFAASAACNSAGSANELPMDTLLACVAALFFVQVFLRVASPAATALGWLANLATLNVAMAHVHTPLWPHINAILLILMASSYEIERSYMSFFVGQKRAVKLQKEVSQQNLEEEIRGLVEKRTMVRHIAHEVRTPLNIIAVATDIILTELRKIPAIPAYLIDTVESCQGACSVACEIINDLLNFEKLAAGMVQLERAPTRLATYLQHAMKPFQVSADARNVKLTFCDKTHGVPPRGNTSEEAVADVDTVKMNSVLRNLLSNAVKFAKDEIIVTLEVEDDDGATHAVVSVADDGAGLSADNLTKLFQEGMQFHANALQAGGGSGFGLFIAKIWATSAGEGHGCTFRVRLACSLMAPESKLRRGSVSFASLEGLVNGLEQDAAAAAAAAAGQLSASASASAGAAKVAADAPLEWTGTAERPLVVLVVDDSSISREMMIHLLRQLCGAHAVFLQAADGQEATATVLRSLCAEGKSLHPSPSTASRPPSNNNSRAVSAANSRYASVANSVAPTPSCSPPQSAAGSASVSAAVSAAPSVAPSVSPSVAPSAAPSRRNSRTMSSSAATTAMLTSAGASMSAAAAAAGVAAAGPGPAAGAAEPAPSTIHIVLMDDNMPRMSGRVAATEMRRWGFSSPIIGITGDTDLEGFVNDGATEALVKPVSKAQLREVLRRHLRAPEPPTEAREVSWGNEYDDNNFAH